MKNESQIELGPKINIYKSTEAPLNVKNNPFYDSEFWGRATSPDEVYLPESDAGISFAMAGHEIGHLVNTGARDDASLDNFEATKIEELRAWQRGFPYLEKYLPDYFENNAEVLAGIYRSFEKIRDLMMQATELSHDMYLEKGGLEKLTEAEQEKILIKQREDFSAKSGNEIKEIFNKIKEQKIGQMVDWEKYVELVTKSIKDILIDNKKPENG